MRYLMERWIYVKNGPGPDVMLDAFEVVPRLRSPVY